MIEYLSMNWYKIEYISLGQTVFAHKHTVEVRASNVNEAVQWFITNKESNRKDWFILEVYEREYAYGKTKWKPQINTKDKPPHRLSKKENNQDDKL